MTTQITQSLSSEIASRAAAMYGGFDISGLMMALPNPDAVLKKLGRDVEVYRDILNDPAIKGAVRRRRSSVVSLKYGLEQGDASDKTLSLCQQVLANINMRGLTRELHDAALYGYSPAEIYWQKQQGLWLPEKVLGKPPEWFSFNHDNELCFRQLGNITGDSVPDMKFIMTRNDATYANPYGVADLAAVYWSAVFRKGGLKFWLRFADKYGQAFVVGKHPRGTPQSEVNLILDSLETLAQDGVAAIPNDGSVEILEAAGKGATADMFERLLKYCRSEINIALLGQDQSTDSSSTNASAQAGLEVTYDIRDADGEMIAEAINTLLRYAVQLNIGDNEVMPTWSMWSDEDITDKLATRDEKLQKAGARLTKVYFQRAYDLAEDEVEVDEIAKAAPSTSTSKSNAGAQVSGIQADFSEQDFAPLRLDYAEANIDKLAAASQSSVDDWLVRLESVINSAPSLEALPDLIAREFETLDDTQLVEVIAEAMTAANLAGRAEVTAEVVDELRS